MILTKTQARTLVQQWLDDPSAQFWSEANLDLLISLVLDDLWAEVLEANPRYLSVLDTLLSADLDSPGYVDLSGDGPLTERFFRIQSVTRDAREYVPVSPQNIVIEADTVIVSEASPRSYYLQGQQLWLFPLDASASIEVRYSYLPADFNGLGASASVVWRDGFESAYILEAAGRAMLKGDRENGERLLGMGRAVHRRLLSTISREYPGPDMPYMSVRPGAWGSVT
jgi:hypothetical protein